MLQAPCSSALGLGRLQGLSGLKLTVQGDVILSLLPQQARKMKG